MPDVLAQLGTVLAFFGGAAVVAVALVGLAYWIFQTWGAQWLQSRFNRQLEDLKHQQAQEMEELRYRINRSMDRSTKLHEKEFEIVPEAWRLLVDAFYTTTAHVSPARMSPGVQRMSDDQLEEFLSETPFYETQKKQLREADPTDQFKVYYELEYLHSHPAAEEKSRELNRYLEKYGIFISMKPQFKEVADMIWDALGEYSNQRELEVRERLARTRLENEGRRKLAALEADIHHRF